MCVCARACVCVNLCALFLRVRLRVFDWVCVCCVFVCGLLCVCSISCLCVIVRVVVLCVVVCVYALGLC